MGIDKLLEKPTAPWLGGGGVNKDVVMSSRIRLARNIENIPFPNRARLAEMDSIAAKVTGLLPDLQAFAGQSYNFIKLSDLSELDQYVLVEKHLISPAFAKNAAGRALLASEDATVSVMFNEEDHIRLQCFKPGLDLPANWELANKIDDILESKLDFAFNERFGYLTACPTNLGTGLRASVMVHLPGLVLTRQLNRVVAAMTQVGLAVRGLYGEGTDGLGNIFQISNQLTIGNTETEIVVNMQNVVLQVVEKELAGRKFLYSEASDTLSDKVYRSFGVLRYAQKLTGQEALSLLSDVRLGVDMGLIEELPADILGELLIITGSNYLQKTSEQDVFDPNMRDKLRAKVVRDKLQRYQNS